MSKTEIMIYWLFGIVCFLMTVGSLVFLGQQLLWQLRRADCGSYTIAQKDTGQIPVQCGESK